MRTMFRETDIPNKVATFRHDGDFYFTYGVKAFKRKDFQKAEKWFHKALDMDPNNALYLCQLSVLYTELHQYHRANDLLQQVIDTSEEPYVDCYYLMANNYAHLGLFYEAKKSAETYLELDPNGDFKQETDELIVMLDQVMVDDAEDDELTFDAEDEFMLYQETAFYHLEHEEWEEALTVLEELIETFPEYLPAKHEYAYTLFQLGSTEDAIQYEETWLDQDPDSLSSRMNLTYFYDQIGRTDLSEPLLEQLKHVYPTYFEKQLKLAVTIAQVNDHAEAIKRFRKLKSDQVTNYLSYYLWFGYALRAYYGQDNANVVWNAAKEQHPTIERLLHAHGWV
ncbi:tetratricopeptide (TPR) repeat protein [Alkalibacillus flavidus]|uniref:Tetratricopeptide (TPR) repeat protein n=1 Tax=Alkalibacillus flavidus TaxID=546021 RepID=A0ABV2KWK5_9BACI